MQSELELESLVVARNQLMQHWTSSLLEMGRQDEALGAMQEAVRWEQVAVEDGHSHTVYPPNTPELRYDTTVEEASAKE